MRPSDLKNNTTYFRQKEEGISKKPIISQEIYTEILRVV